MLIELHVVDLGVIEELHLVLGPGMTALTGETGAGKTLLVGAVELLVGGRADAAMVRPGADEAAVDGRFELDGEEVVLRRVVPRSGRSRAYVDGRPVTAATLAELGGRLVDLYGQHDHQSLLRTAVQRHALDRFGDVDLAPLQEARARVADLDRALAELGGDERTRARELDLARYQLDELTAAGLEDPDEDDALQTAEATLGDALAHREAGAAAAVALDAEGGAADRVAEAAALLADRAPFAALRERLAGIAAELDDVRGELRDRAEAIEDDPRRLAEVQARRTLLTELRRKYGDTLAEVLAVRDELAERVAALEGHEATAARLEAERAEAEAQRSAAAAAVGRARRLAAGPLAEAVQAHLADLALDKARLAVTVGEDPGDDVTFLLAANPGAEPRPLAKVASGGELARTMLALRLVLSDAPPVLLFDEVDAGIGGAAAVAVGRALADLGRAHQVLVVTHLPQVAAAADHQVSVTKRVDGATTTTTVTALDDDERVVEIGRMLSGAPDSEVARAHAEELLAGTGRAAPRGRRGGGRARKPTPSR